jgi:hypothetical protein
MSDDDPECCMFTCFLSFSTHSLRATSTFFCTHVMFAAESGLLAGVDVRVDLVLAPEGEDCGSAVNFVRAPASWLARSWIRVARWYPKSAFSTCSPRFAASSAVLNLPLASFELILPFLSPPLPLLS